MPSRAVSTGVRAREELREWYVASLRPRLQAAVAAGTVEPSAVQALDLQLSTFFDRRESRVRERV